MQFLFDTGASCTVISHKLWTRIPAGSRPELAESQIRLATVGDHEILVWGRCPLALEFNGHQITCMVHVCEVAEEAVLGVDALRALGAQWDWDQDTLIIGQPDLELSRFGCSGVDQDGPAELTDSSQDDNQLEKLIEPGQTAAAMYQDMEVLEEPTEPTRLAGLKRYWKGPVFPKTTKIAAVKGESTQVEVQQGPAEGHAGYTTKGPSTKLKDRLRTAHEAARAHSTTAMVTQKRQYDHNVRLVSYQEGEVVWLHCPIRRLGKSFKLTRPWTGPYVIIKSISEVTFRIQKSPRGKAQIVHADRLKPCVGLSARDLGFPDLVGDTEPTGSSAPNQGPNGQDTSLALAEGSSEETRDSLDPVEYTGSPESEDNPPQDPPKITTDSRKGRTPVLKTGSDWDYLPRSRRARPVRKPVRYGYND